mmetsp:Transcript_80923/g.142768  ORF Transcript_80923/g.142768 Transcript_80923/m.142768 type:complete len:164 (+) Transcript_80923:25-516(+)|eukprot:CAMPEP_0197629756 /NCGR_PEP_ID=MMETSP1338-20131121/7488_1 /TAXON_ID=43686 ORGANISM="Pelagodinium beii, Strain RCC1491" /NCGR_SAMPLE_ID=MMETSP1338 /ASSEMBLY_ACC=CAM_ASM_000754 /LENGTH=163 /DNA_ID=CAMNT_0043200849 /DNA_START=24 /DNA_END=515 /DNA_ORIENTATION=+
MTPRTLAVPTDLESGQAMLKNIETMEKSLEKSEEVLRQTLLARVRIYLPLAFFVSFLVLEGFYLQAMGELDEVLSQLNKHATMYTTIVVFALCVFSTVFLKLESMYDDILDQFNVINKTVNALKPLTDEMHALMMEGQKLQEEMSKACWNPAAPSTSRSSFFY